jgi:glyoxylase-like metal-dependent hydrolase (beta-lactamase superfamily II)
VTLSLGDRVVQFHHLGRGHTDNDAIAVIPDAGVVFAGDLVEESAPPGFQDSFPLEWPATLAAVLGHVSGPVVPGHGAVVDGAFAVTQQEEIAEIARLAREHHAAGATPAEAAGLGGPYPQQTLEVAFARAWQQMDRQ